MNWIKTITWAYLVSFLLIAAGHSLAGEAPAPAGVRELSLQVWALRGIHELDLTDTQLRSLRPMASPVDIAGVKPAKTDVPDKYVKSLRSIRQALIKRDDEDQIAELQDDLESMREDDDIELDDTVTISPAARSKVPELMRLITPSQAAGYIAKYQDEIPDPVESLMDAADDARGADDEEYKSAADETADEVSSLIAGLDLEKAKPVAEQIRAWMKRGRTLGDAEFKAKRPELEKAARELVGDVDSLTVLRHWMQRDMAELLSNPQLVASIEARMPRN